MKKFISVLLSAVMVMSLATTAFAAEHETLVTYEGQGVSEYLLTVPAKLAPAQSDSVKLEGTWPTNETIHVTADPTVTLTNDIDSSTKILDIEFNGISQSGSNTESVTVTEDISVSAIENALFGTWSGEFYYNLRITADTMVKLGDVNNSGRVDNGDAILVMQMVENSTLVTPDNAQSVLADVNEDGVLTEDDYTIIQKFAVELDVSDVAPNLGKYISVSIDKA